MAATAMGAPTRSGRERKSRPILGIKRPSETAQLGGIEQRDNSGIADELQAFEAMLRQSRNDWSIRRARQGLFGWRLDRAGADRALKLALAGIGGGL